MAESGPDTRAAVVLAVLLVLAAALPSAACARVLDCRYSRVYICDGASCAVDSDPGGMTFDDRRRTFSIRLGESEYSGTLTARLPAGLGKPLHVVLNGIAVSPVTGRTDRMQVLAVVDQAGATMIRAASGGTFIYLCGRPGQGTTP